MSAPINNDGPVQVDELEGVVPEEKIDLGQEVMVLFANEAQKHNESAEKEGKYIQRRHQRIIVLDNLQKIVNAATDRTGKVDLTAGGTNKEAIAAKAAAFDQEAARLEEELARLNANIEQGEEKEPGAAPNADDKALAEAIRKEIEEIRDAAKAIRDFAQKDLYTKDEKDLLVKNLSITRENLGVLNQMQTQAVQKYHANFQQVALMANQIIKRIDEALKSVIRGVRGG
jgi:predicted  nucleic acid-binding Zn-ribbon protein